MTKGAWWPWTWATPNFPRGVHPPMRKEATSERPIEVLATPSHVILPLHQHTGAPAEPVVKPRDQVPWGHVIALPHGERISAGVHAPVTGIVRPLTAVTLPNGRRSPAIPVETGVGTPSGHEIWDALFGGDWPDVLPPHLTADTILTCIRDAGVTGMGGAAFPTHVKLTPQHDKPVHTVLVNGCECEPYLTADDRLMREAPRAIVSGADLARRACGARHITFAVEDNKPAAIRALEVATAHLAESRVIVCRTKYPMGGERQLIPAVFGKAVPAGGFPNDLGIVVINVGTAAAIAAAVLRGRPLTHRVLTVAGAGVREPKNLLVPLGTPLRDVLAACGGLRDEARRVIAGGPMMGFTVTDLSIPVTKGTSGLTVLAQADIDEEAATPCIRCGRCVDVCPLGLMPTKIAHAVKHHDLARAQAYDLEACCECGCCAYECPARIPLVQYLRMGKLAAIEQKRPPQPAAH